MQRIARQKLFAACFPSLELAAKSVSPASRALLLLACLRLLEQLPKSLLSAESTRLAALVVQSLPCQGALQLRICALGALRGLMERDGASIEQHLPSLVRSLLELSCERGMVRVRVCALQCLALATKLPYHTLFPLRATVVKGLARSLDDGKRVVRQHAALCRNEWLIQAQGDQQEQTR